MKGLKLNLIVVMRSGHEMDADFGGLWSEGWK